MRLATAWCAGRCFTTLVDHSKWIFTAIQCREFKQHTLTLVQLYWKINDDSVSTQCANIWHHENSFAKLPYVIKRPPGQVISSYGAICVLNVFEQTQHIFSFPIISPNRRGTGSWYRPISKETLGLSCTVKTMAADLLQYTEPGQLQL